MTSEEYAKAYMCSKSGMLRITELILAIIIQCLVGWYHLELRAKSLLIFLLFLCVFACIVILIITLIMHCCGKDSICEFWFCVFGAVVYLIYGCVLFYTVYSWGLQGWQTYGGIAGVLCIINCIVFAIDAWEGRDNVIYVYD